LYVSEDIFRRLSLKEGPQGLAAVARQRWSAIADVRLEPGRPWVALDSVADPGNLGTILRTNDGAGGAGVILLDQSTDPFDPAAMRASMGAIFSQKVCRARLEDFAGWRKTNSSWVVGTSGSAESDYHTATYPDAFVLMMGSERHGLAPQHVALCDQMVSIPMLGKSDSLNLAVATAVILYETLNQRRDRMKGK
jgi:TrmH family RNA methyltransferase